MKYKQFEVDRIELASHMYKTKNRISLAKIAKRVYQWEQFKIMKGYMRTTNLTITFDMVSISILGIVRQGPILFLSLKNFSVETSKRYDHFEARDLQMPTNTCVTDKRWP